jgi:hypothetical protein
MALTTNVRAGIAARQTPTTALDLAPAASVPHSKDVALAFATGTAAGQADLIFSDTRTLAASANEDLDLAGGLTGAFGTSLTFVKVKVIFVAAAAGNTNNVIVGGAPANAFVNWVSDATDKVVVKPGGFLMLSVGTGDLAGYGVTAGTGDLLRIANSGGTTSVTYDIVVFGTSA